MTNNQAFAEFQYAVNHWFKHMDDETRHRAVQVAALAITEVERDTDVRNLSVAAHAPVVAQQAPVTKVPSGKGQVFIGKTWMLNKATGERARVAQEEVQAYLARGFIKAGPRSVA